MDRNNSNDPVNGASASSNSMPNVLFREIHKNAFLKRHSSDRRTGFPKKSERVWVVFCVHDDVEPFLEIYSDQKVALTHKPEWFASLSNALHVSPTICGNEDEFEFAVTLSFQVVRLAAPSWESMMEWVETIRNKLRELKVLSPKENVYSRMPEQKQPLLPTRDPNSPLPLPPEGPSTLLPGVELVHLESRNNSGGNNDGNIGRHQRPNHARPNILHERQANKNRVYERDKRSAVETSKTSEIFSSSSSSNNNTHEVNNDDPIQSTSNLSNDIKKKKLKVKRAASVPEPKPSTSHVAVNSNVTVIEVPSVSNRESHSLSDMNTTIDSGDNTSDTDEADEVFHNPSITHKTGIKTNEMSHEEETHYEHVFLSSVQINKLQPFTQIPPSFSPKCLDGSKHKISKPHSTSVIINSDSTTLVNSSQNENCAIAGSSNQSNNVSDPQVQVDGNLTCVNLIGSEKSDSTVAIGSQQISTKLEKVNISGIIPRVPAKSTKNGVFKPVIPCGKDTNVTAEISNCSNQYSISLGSTQFSGLEESKGNCLIVSQNEENACGPSYSQVKKGQKVKVKSEDLKNYEQNPGKSGPPIIRKLNEFHNVETEPQSSLISIVNPKIPIKNEISKKNSGNKNSAITNISVKKDLTPNQRRSPHANYEHKIEIVNSSASTSGNRIDNIKINGAKKDLPQNSNNNSETEPLTATVQPAVGVISVEDIPLIGGHQRRRRRSSSSEVPPSLNLPPSRVIGGADRIRINVPITSNHMVREESRNEVDMRSSSHIRNSTDQIVQINVNPQSSRLTLREQQVLQLKKEMLHPGGVRLQLRRKDCTGSIALVDALNGVWVAGWKQKEHPLLYNALHIGDQLVNVCDVAVRNSAEAQKLIRNSTSLYIEFIIRRVPYGNVFALQRSSEGQNLGIIQEGNTAEIKEVLPNSIAAKQGLTSKTPSSDGLSLTTWFLTEINGRPLNLFFKDNEVRDRLNAVGKEISILVQPHDFIKQIKKQLKNIRGYKDYIVQ